MPIGIDLSKWNTLTNAIKVADQVDFVILRSGFATTEDEKFKLFALSFKRLGVKILGAYNFSYALNERQAVAEAEFAVKLLKELNLPPETLLFFDYEYDSLRYAKSYGYNPTKQTVSELTEAFCERVKELGYRPGIYLNVDFYNNWYEKEPLEKYPIWLADWRQGKTHEDVLIHQYSATGKIEGINGDVDMDRYYPDNDKEATPPATDDPVTKLAEEVIEGKWGNGEARKQNLLTAIQSKVNQLLRGGN